MTRNQLIKEWRVEWASSLIKIKVQLTLSFLSLWILSDKRQRQWQQQYERTNLKYDIYTHKYACECMCSIRVYYNLNGINRNNSSNSSVSVWSDWFTRLCKCFYLLTFWCMELGLQLFKEHNSWLKVQRHFIGLVDNLLTETLTHIVRVVATHRSKFLGRFVFQTTTIAILA